MHYILILFFIVLLTPFQVCAADKLITELTQATTTTNVEEVPIYQSGSTKKIDIGSFLNTPHAYIQAGETVPRGWEMKTRPALDYFPVPYIRPRTANTLIALDVMPNGTPAEMGGVGVAWIDVCKEDLSSTDGAYHSTRVAMQSDKALIGSIGGGGATAYPLHIVAGNMKAVLDPVNNRMGVNVTSPTYTLDVASGWVNSVSGYKTNGAGFCELFESDSEIPVGTPVGIVDGKIKPAGTDALTIGVVSDRCGYIGNTGVQGIPVSLLGQEKILPGKPHGVGWRFIKHDGDYDIWLVR